MKTYMFKKSRYCMLQASGRAGKSSRTARCPGVSQQFGRQLGRGAEGTGLHSNTNTCTWWIICGSEDLQRLPPPVTLHMCISSWNVRIWRSVFTARRICLARTMPWQGVCLSVRLSHAGIESITVTHIFKFISPSGSPTILVFPHQEGWQYSDGGVEYNGIWKHPDFRLISCLISHMMQHRAIVTEESNRKPHPSFQMVPVWMTLSDL